MVVTPAIQVTDAALIGLVSYNGYELTPARAYTFDMEPVYDDAGRSVMYNKYTLKGRWYIASDTAANSSTAMASIRQKLSEAGKKLTLTGIGFGDITIGGDATTKDVFFGPKPRSGHLEPCGGLIAWVVDWSVEFHIHECDSPGRSVGLLAFNKEVAIDIDQRGLTRYSLSGYWQIASNSADIANTTADSRRDQFAPAVADGFKRVSQSYKESKDGCRMDFSVIDQELDGPAFPAGIVEADVKYEITNVNRSFASWTATLSGTLETKKDTAKSVAAQKFCAIVADKRDKLLQAAGGSGAVIPERFSFGTELFTRKSSFSITFAVTGCLPDFLNSSGMWDEVPESNGQQWRASMNDAWSSRGLAKVRLAGNAVIDICSNPNIPSLGSPGYNPGGPTTPPESPILTCDNVTTENSWLAYENHIRFASDQNAEVHSIAQAVGTPLYVAGNIATGGLLFMADSLASQVDAFAKGQPQSLSSAINPTIQLRGAPEDYIVMYGKAMRVKFRPTAPTISKVGNNVPILINSVVEPAQLFAQVGSDHCPVYTIRWAYLYKLEGYLDSQSNVYGSPNPAEICAGEH